MTRVGPRSTETMSTGTMMIAINATHVGCSNTWIAHHPSVTTVANFVKLAAVSSPAIVSTAVARASTPAATPSERSRRSGSANRTSPNIAGTITALRKATRGQSSKLGSSALAP